MAKAAVKKVKGSTACDLAALTRQLAAYNALHGTDYELCSRSQEEAKKHLWTLKCIAYAHQEAIDTLSITARRDLKFGHQRNKWLKERYEENSQELMRLRNEDTEDLEYFEAKVEEALLDAEGPDEYVPRAERYQVSLVTPSGQVVAI